MKNPFQEKRKKVFARFNYINKFFSTKNWEIGFSGGKDSTLLLHLLFEFLEKHLKTKENFPSIYIVHTDVLLEYPPLRKHTISTIRKIKKYIRKRFLFRNFRGWLPIATL